MFKHCMIGVVSILAASAALVCADPIDDVKAAVQKLADSPNYSWTTKTVAANGGFGGGQTDGKTQKDGLTWLSLQRRDTTTEIFIKGDKVAIKTDDGWKTPEEATANDDGNGGPSPMRFIGMMAANFKTPVAQAQDNLDKLTNLQKTDDGYTADLTPDAAKEMLSFRRRPTTNPDGDDNAPQIDITDAKASVKLTVADGTLTKVEFHLTGSISFNGGDPRDVDRTSTTEFKDVGATTIDVPDDAKAKLGS